MQSVQPMNSIDFKNVVPSMTYVFCLICISIYGLVSLKYLINAFDLHGLYNLNNLYVLGISMAWSCYELSSIYGVNRLCFWLTVYDQNDFYIT